MAEEMKDNTVVITDTEIQPKLLLEILTLSRDKGLDLNIQKRQDIWSQLKKEWVPECKIQQSQEL